MKIAIAINRSWNIYNFREGIVKSLLKDGHEVLAIAPKDNYTEKLLAWGCSFEALEVAPTSANPFAEMMTILRFRRILRRNKVDVLLTYTVKFNIYGIIAARSSAIPCICNVSGLGTVFLSHGLISSIARLLYRITFRYATHIFFQNTEDHRDFLRIIGLKKISTSILPGSGINLSAFPLSAYKPADPIVFLMVSRLLIDKGVREYLLAAEKVRSTNPDVIFKLVGGMDTGHRRSIDPTWFSTYQEKGIVEYHGHSDDVAGFIRGADVVVLPSYREGTPRTLLEGGAIGRPLIATDVPGCREVVIDGKNGFLCRAQDADDLAKTFSRFISLPGSEKGKMATESRKIVEEKFDEKRVIDAYLNKISDMTT